MKLQRRLLAALGILAIILGLMYISWPVGHIPPYDANLTRLAESNLQGYCSGETFMMTGGMGGASKASLCRTRLAKYRSNKPDLQAVQTAFCEAIIVAGWEGQVSDCLGILVANQYWPTYDGSITNEWNRARPYPRTFLAPGTTPSDTSRTGTHDGSSRSFTPYR